ncbi:MAG TPA: nodulation protein NfeD [Thermodesulfobacteriota bacterium]|nr:nodulation protein NfeD [Thermodesulfobacteriota bacterium]
MLSLFPFPTQAQEKSPIYTIKIDGSINPPVADFIARSVAKAEKDKAAALVVELDTPGGLDSSMRSIVQTLLNTPVPVAVFVSPSGARAASAGVLIILAADVAAMAPGTNIGAAHPVNIGGKDIEKTMAKKVEKDMVAYVRSIAEQRKRNPDWFENAVLKSESVSAEKALELKVIDLMANDVNDLLLKIDGRKIATSKQPKVFQTKDRPVVPLHEDFRDRILRVLSDPNLAYVLMMLGMMGIFFELLHPGGIFPGVIGGICLIVAFFALQTLPVNFAGILLIVLAVVFFIAEVKVISHGLLTVAGIVALTLGSLMLFKTGEGQMGVSLQVLITTVLVISLFFIMVISLALKAHRRKPQTGSQGILKELGRVQLPIAPEKPGKVLVHGEYWNAQSDEPIGVNETVEVIGIEGLMLKVKKKA